VPLLALVTGHGAAQSVTQDEALALAFPPGVSVERLTAFLNDSDLEQIKTQAGPGVEGPSSVVTYYRGTRDGVTLGTAYFDAHRVRTLNEVVMVVVGPQDTVARIEVLHFAEPPEYRPPQPWLDQFTGLVLDRNLSLKGSVIPLTGATLTSDAVTDAVRRVLAVHHLIAGSGPGPREPS